MPLTLPASGQFPAYRRAPHRAPPALHLHLPRPSSFIDHSAVKPLLGGKYAGRIDQNNLRFLVHDDSAQPHARGLRFLRNNGDFLSDQGI